MMALYRWAATYSKARPDPKAEHGLYDCLSRTMALECLDLLGRRNDFEEKDVLCTDKKSVPCARVSMHDNGNNPDNAIAECAYVPTNCACYYSIITNFEPTDCHVCVCACI